MSTFLVLSIPLIIAFGFTMSYVLGFYFGTETSVTSFDGVPVTEIYSYAYGFPLAWRTVYPSGHGFAEHYAYNAGSFAMDTAAWCFIASVPIAILHVFQRRERMFRGEKTNIFWAGLVVFALASVILFSILWYIIMIYGINYDWKFAVPPIVGAVVFVLIGLCMMRFGVKKEKRETPGTPKLL